MEHGSWTLEETSRLVKLARANEPASTISMMLGRSREEVDAKMSDLALHRPVPNPQPPHIGDRLRGTKPA
jgi:hypothetical protein